MMSDLEKKMLESSSSSDDDEEKVVELLDELMKTKIDLVITDAVDENFKDVDSRLKEISSEFIKLNSFSQKVNSCLDRTKDTLGKWVFPRFSHGINGSDQHKNSLSNVKFLQKEFGSVVIKNADNALTDRRQNDNSSRYHSSVEIDSLNEVIPVKKVMPSIPKLPPIGATVIKPPLKIGMRVYCMASSIKDTWHPGSIVDILDPKINERYKIKMFKKRPFNKTLSGKSLAYMLRPNVLLPVGTRVIAAYKDEPVETEAGNSTDNSSFKHSLYVGIIAEPPKSMNSYKYLIFFDDGYAQYNAIEEVFLVCEGSKCVWEDIHPDTSSFIKEYLMQYPERPMVKLQRGQFVKTEWNGSWWNAKVVAVKGSLVKMFFEADRRTEWIYRGSTRLAPLFYKLSKKDDQASGRVKRQGLTSNFNSQRLPYVEYTYSNDDNIENSKEEDQTKKVVTSGVTASRNVAKKSVSKKAKSPPPTDKPSTNVLSTSIEKTYVAMTMLPTYKFHRVCKPACLETSSDNFESFKGLNPLEIPMHNNWRREIVKDRMSRKKLVYYVAPCGRRLRDLEETNSYLMLTNSKLTIDLFCYDSYVQTFQKFSPGRALMEIRDISYGKESVPVPCINTYNKEKPHYVEYSTRRIPGRNVPLNLDENFLSCCDCEDNCQNRSNCSCQQLTVEMTNLSPGGTDPKAGYIHRRLEEQVFTGLYECNQKCKCNQQCMNRVAQSCLKNRLQLFKTSKKGWGLRTLDDIPKGSFICIYAGQLLTEHEANQDGTLYGDEYMAELDYIEVVENQMKEGYESDIPKSEEESINRDAGEMSNSDSSFNEIEDQLSSDSEDLNNELNAETKKLRSSDVQQKSKSEICNSDDGESLLNFQNEELPDLGNDIMETPNLPISVRPLSPNTKEKLSASKISRKPRLDFGGLLSYSDSEEDQKLTESQSDSENKGSSDKEEHTKESNRMISPTTKHSHSLYSKSSMNNSNPSANDDSDKNNSSVRSHFQEQYCYVMDAKSCGNIGRYLNHSCSPNVFVQNVFVDTHDLRFPWVAFFSGQFIRAGEELTWDYNYEVGSVKGREIYCHCGSSNCRGRLL